MLATMSRFGLLTALLLTWAPLAGATAPVPHQLVRVSLAGSFDRPVSGRLLVFAMPAELAAKTAREGRPASVDASPMHPTRTTIAAREIHHLVPGASVQIDADALAFPQGFSRLEPGPYAVQAVLDVNHDYAYSGRGAGDLVSAVQEVKFGPGSPMPSLTLDKTLPERFKDWQLPADMPAAAREKMQPQLDAAHAHSREIDFVSPALSAFRGQPVHMRAWVVLPPGYDTDTKQRYPVVYYTHGFGGSLHSLVFPAADIWQQMHTGQMPPMIWVLLDESCATGTHEFADSRNNGPWGQALTRELIPHLEAQFRMDGKPAGRFLQGHSSGGWATLWLQVRYPKVFGGTWSTSPDPSDFHDFTGVDLYAPDANVYHDAKGGARPLVRVGDKVVATFEQYARMERVLGSYGGQMASFEWVFSPRAADGRPLPMFDRDTGKVDPVVVHYWREHYDIAQRIRDHWPQLKADLDGKVHLYVGTADTFYLDGAAHRLKAAYDAVGGKAEFHFLPGRSHFDLYAKGEDRHWLLSRIAWDMYRQARPGAAIPAAWQDAGKLETAR